jgi:DNA-binding response OmpR family regulator/anti-sigma regulatory factor (Ser/Thr protein kinase)
MVRFINQLLDFQKVQSGKMGLKICSTEMVAFVKDITGYFTEAANEKEIELSVTSNVDVLYAWIDTGKIDIVIYNLLSNAFKFTPRGKRIEIQVEHIAVNNHFTIRVIDQGIGVPPDKLQDIFELYYEVDKPATDHLAGTGIGLALSREIIGFHHGKIYAGNNLAKGLTVTVELQLDQEHFKGEDVIIVNPATEAKSPAETYRTSRYQQPAGQAERPLGNPEETRTVLIVDDNAELRGFLADQLTPHYKVLEAENGREGLNKATQFLPDLVLSDVMMPEMNGIAMLDQLKNNVATSHIPVILLTAKSSVESQLEGLNYGADFYITKPFHASVVLALIGNLLKQRKRLFELLLAGDKEATVTELQAPEVSPGIVITAKDEAFLKEVIAIVEKSMEDPRFNIDKVAEALLMGRTTFYKKLKSLTNMSPVEFIREVRLQKSKDLLDTGTGNIASIAYEVGFSNAKYFSTCFKERYNMSPSDYLRLKKAGNLPTT